MNEGNEKKEQKVKKRNARMIKRKLNKKDECWAKNTLDLANRDGRRMKKEKGSCDHDENV